jgi:carboxymethylenebutenolidase
MKYASLVLLLLAAQAASAQEWAKQALEKSPRHREWVTVKHDGRSVQTFVAYPEANTKTPVVLVVHEIFGLSDWAQEVTDELAAAGYIAVAPDLLSGMGPNGGRTDSLEEGKVMETVSHLDPDQVTADLNAAADYAMKIPASNGKLFVVGFCWGGGESFRFATTRQDIAADFVFYGPGPEAASIAHIKAPVYAFYAGNDARIDVTVPDTAATMRADGKKFDPVMYQGAGHGFMRAGEEPNPDPANARAREQSWLRLKKLLALN